MAIQVLVFVTLLSYLFCTSHASTTRFSPPSSSSSSNNTLIATEQIKVWAQNVQNKMPQFIINKLSPLTKQESNLFSTKIHSETNDKRFKVDVKFCSLANLACGSSLNNIKVESACQGNYIMCYASPAGPEIKNELASSLSFSFFRLSTVRPGNLFYLPKMGQSLPDRAFLPLQVASKVSLASFNDILKLFGSSWNKGTQDVIKTTLSNCNGNHGIKGEIKSCPKSLEELISFSKSVLVDQHDSKLLLRVLTSESNKGWNKELLIKNVKKYIADKIVTCHELLLPFATYYCHKISSSNLYHVDLVEPNSGVAVNRMLAICHMDTSAWSPDHVAFEILKFGPGEGEVCHWIAANEFAWISSK